MIPIGVVRQIVRYPVKSMAGTSVDSGQLGWHGLDGDRRFAIRRINDVSGFPWLTASRFPELLLFRPFGAEISSGEPLPTHVRTPSGDDLEIRHHALRDQIAERIGSEVEMMSLRNGMFDDADVSVISSATVGHICDDAGVSTDSRRFRANIVLETNDPKAFEEDVWVGGVLLFGDAEGARVAVTAGDVRCMMINLNPDTARQDSGVMKSVVRRNNNIAGVYGSAIRTGAVHVGQAVFLGREHFELRS